MYFAFTTSTLNKLTWKSSGNLSDAAGDVLSARNEDDFVLFPGSLLFVFLAVSLPCCIKWTSTPVWIHITYQLMSNAAHYSGQKKKSALLDHQNRVSFKKFGWQGYLKSEWGKDVFGCQTELVFFRCMTRSWFSLVSNMGIQLWLA